MPDLVMLHKVTPMYLVQENICFSLLGSKQEERGERMILRAKPELLKSRLAAVSVLRANIPHQQALQHSHNQLPQQNLKCYVLETINTTNFQFS